MPLTKELILDAFRTVSLPAPGADLAIRHVAVCDGYASARIAVDLTDAPALDSLAASLQQAAMSHAKTAGEPLLGLTIDLISPDGALLKTFTFGRPALAPQAGPAAQAPGHRPIPGLNQHSSTLPNVRNIVAVGAGKGGVGKSSIAVNLAVGLARRGHAVGLLDGDIYGPSIPTMLGLHALEQSVVAGHLQPFYTHGVKAITIGKLVDPDKPLIWRGPMAHGAFKQLAEQTDWGELDYLIIDLPPGTGDVSLTMAQMLQLTGAVVVCTPQRVAQDDAVRAAKMFQQLGIEVLGVVENMSCFIGDDGKLYDLFGMGGAEKMAARLNLPFLGAVPVTTALRINSDQGSPSANFEGDTPLRRSLEALVDSLERQTALASMRQGKSRPTLKVS